MTTIGEGSFKLFVSCLPYLALPPPSKERPFSRDLHASQFIGLLSSSAGSDASRPLSVVMDPSFSECILGYTPSLTYDTDTPSAPGCSS
jgi:hypothetical protein